MRNTITLVLALLFSMLFANSGSAWAVTVTGDTGPGGVGSTDGTSNLTLWLKGDNIIDGAEPSPNHIAALNLLKLAVLAESDNYATRAESLLRAGAGMLEKQQFSAPVLLSAHDLHNRGVRHFQIPEKEYSPTLSKLSTSHRPRAVFNSHTGTDVLLYEGQSCKIFEE